MTDPTRDPRLADALRDDAGEPPFGAADLERLRAGIAARAELPLARLRREAVTSPAGTAAAAADGSAGFATSPAPASSDGVPSPPPAASSPIAPARPLRRWSPAVRLAAAACVAAVALAGTLRVLPRGDAGERAPLPAQEAQVVDEIVSASLPEGLPDLLSGEAAEAALLEAAVGS